MNLMNRIRIPLDTMMTLVSIVLMGGAYFFSADVVHEILGVILFALDYVSIIILFAMGIHYLSKLFNSIHNQNVA